VNERPTVLKPVGPASLAGEEDFQLGDIWVRPSLREVEANGARESLEPRVMQVLVALARANGAVVSRDELIRQCWGGRIVGEDAINRCVSKIRQLAEIAGGKAFEIETIPRVGYRLLRRNNRSAVEAAPASFRADVAVPRTAAPKKAAMRFGVGKLAFLAALAMALVAATAAMIMRMPTPAAEWAVAESHQPFIATTDSERFPSFSPDGTMIAFAEGKSARSHQIFLQLRRGGAPLELTRDAFDDISPAFSPDGASVAYFAYEAGQPCRIMLVQIPSGPARQIGRCRSVERSSMSWDRGGHALFYEDKVHPNEFLHIVRYNVDTGALTEITRSGAAGSISDFQPSASPEGRSILLMRYLKGDRLQVVLHELKSGVERVLVDDDADKYAVWSNDSSAVFVASNRGSDSSLWAYPVSGAAPWRITSNARPMELMSSGPDGLLAVELKNKVTQLSIASATAKETPRPLDTDSLSGCSFDYAPDGTLAMIAKNVESPIIAIGAPGHLREVLRLKTRAACGIHWSPDGKQIAFGGSDDAGFRISVIGRDGLPIAQVPYPTQDFVYFEWTPDGKGFLQTRLDPRGGRVWRVELASPHRAAPILPYGWGWAHIRNGMIFGMKDGSSGIWRIDGTPKRLTDWPSADLPWTWTIAGDRLVYRDSSSLDGRRIVAQSIGRFAQDYRLRR